MDGFPDAKLKPRAVRLDLLDERGQPVFVSIPLSDVPALVAKLIDLCADETRLTTAEVAAIAHGAAELIEEQASTVRNLRGN